MEQVFIVIFIGKSINEPYNYSLYDNAFLLIQFAQLSLISRSWIFAVSFKLDSHSASEKPLKLFVTCVNPDRAFQTNFIPDFGLFVKH